MKVPLLHLAAVQAAPRKHERYGAQECDVHVCICPWRCVAIVASSDGAMVGAQQTQRCGRARGWGSRRSLRRHLIASLLCAWWSASLICCCKWSCMPVSSLHACALAVSGCGCGLHICRLLAAAATNATFVVTGGWYVCVEEADCNVGSHMMPTLQQQQGVGVVLIEGRQ